MCCGMLSVTSTTSVEAVQAYVETSRIILGLKSALKVHRGLDLR
jgi:hypothetical protein